MHVAAKIWGVHCPLVSPISTPLCSYFCLIICAGVYVPLGGKKLLTFMDDFNMPAKDTFGSQPPLELIRQWIDYNFWYDRQKQTVKHIKVKRKTVLLTLS